MHTTSLITLLALTASITACLIANFQYLAPSLPPPSARAKPHLIGNLTSTNHPAYPYPICWLSKKKLEAPNDMYPLYCIDVDMTAYIYMQGMVPYGATIPSGSLREEVIGKSQAVGFTDGKAHFHGDFALGLSPEDGNVLGAWNYECGAEDALW